MVIVKLQGGLGNQMFQYAIAKSIAGKQPIYFDTAFLDSRTIKTTGFTPRKLEIFIFKEIRIRTLNKFALHTLKGNKILDRFFKRILFNKITILHQSEKNELIDLNNITSSTVYLDGYFQNEKYFNGIREQLLKNFKFPLLSGDNKIMEQKITTIKNTVSIHIRRGDYLSPEINAYHGVLPLSYYQQAKAIMEAEIPLPYYFIFSDDPEWCSTNITFLDNATIVSNPLSNSWEDMYLMSLCENHIIANSSYSWWGAWLNKNPNKVVIAPDKWFATTVTDIVPENWIKI